MGILLKKGARLLVEGISDRSSRFYAERCSRYGGNIVAVVSKEAASFSTAPIFTSIEEATREVEIDAALIFSPGKEGLQATKEALFVSVPLVICCVKKMPVHEQLFLERCLENSSSILLGPGSEGVLSPEEALLGVLSIDLYPKGNLGVISRSSFLAEEFSLQIRGLPVGVSTHVSLGSDLLLGGIFSRVLRLFEKDVETKAVLILAAEGELLTEDVASISKSCFSKTGVYLAKKNVQVPSCLQEVNPLESPTFIADILQEKGALLTDDPTSLGMFATKLLEKTL